MVVTRTAGQQLEKERQGRVAAPAPDRQAEAAAGRGQDSRKVVLVHAGARDSYQLAVGLAEAGLLDVLVTDLFWSEESRWARWVAGRLPVTVRSTLQKRSVAGLPTSRVKRLPATGLGGILLDRLPRVPFGLKRRWVRAADAALGRAAGRRARLRGLGLLSYSYTGWDAFRAFGGAGMLFQVHPHPATMRRILREELDRHPECRASLEQEWELALPERDFEHLVEETRMATRYLAASSFTRDSLVENGMPADRIAVVPYGVDLERFRPDAARMADKATRGGKLRLLFVGRINQRKGLAYLLETLRGLGAEADQVELTICGRVLDDLAIFKPFAGQIRIRPSVSAEDLVQAYQEADLFVFPSVGEGFGQVLLESLACGLPVLATTHTAAPDLIEDGAQGFVVEPRRPEQMVERLRWALANRAELAAMGSSARLRAERFTWERFRAETAAAVRAYLTEDAVATDPAAEVGRTAAQGRSNALPGEAA